MKLFLHGLNPFFIIFHQDVLAVEVIIDFVFDIFNRPPAKGWWNGRDTGSVVKTKVISLAALALTL